ncbi:hypothetical protein [Dethiothermospora halolimnae]
MEEEKKDKKILLDRFRFLSIGWWIVHILLLLVVYFIIKNF